MGCGHVGVVIHELAHVAGFWHEQSRPDRDRYITIITGNIHPAMLHNFQTYPHDRQPRVGLWRVTPNAANKGVCLSGRNLPTDDEVDQLLIELAAFVAKEPVQRGLPTCNLDQLDQQWTILQSSINSTTGGNAGTPVCAFSPEHNLTEWYTVNTSDANGWLRCHCINTFAQGLLYRDGVVRGLTYRASPNMFSGKQHSTKQPGNETCTNTTVTMGTHFHCQKGYYLKSVNIDSGRVTCCNDHTQKDYTLSCQTMTVPMVTGVEKVQLCTSSGYYVVYSNKECPVHDACHNVVKCCH